MPATTRATRRVNLDVDCALRGVETDDADGRGRLRELSRGGIEKQRSATLAARRWRHDQELGQRQRHRSHATHDGRRVRE